MTDYTRETVTTQESGAVSTKKGASISQTIEYIIYFMLSILEILLAFRLVLKILGANPTSAFVAFIYDVTRAFVLPFSGIFPAGFNEGVVTTSIFEPATLMAMIVYALVAWGVVALVRIISGQTQE